MARAMICLDTNYLIRGLTLGSPESRELRTWFKKGEVIVTSTVAWYEFLCGPVSEGEIRAMHAFLHELLTFDESQAGIAAALFNAGGRKRANRVDTMIAAAAISAGARLATRNRADFARFAESGLVFA
jgi:predicted nucleic acid-binding protein